MFNRLLQECQIKNLSLFSFIKHFHFLKERLIQEVENQEIYFLVQVLLVTLLSIASLILKVWGVPFTKNVRVKSWIQFELKNTITKILKHRLSHWRCSINILVITFLSSNYIKLLVLNFFLKHFQLCRKDRTLIQQKCSTPDNFLCLIVKQTYWDLIPCW